MKPPHPVPVQARREALGDASTARLAALAAVATAAISLMIGIAIGSLVSGAAKSAIRLGRQDPRLPGR